MAKDAQEAQLREAIQSFGEAWAQGDLKALEALLSPTYTHADAYGAFHDRDGWLAYAGARTGRSTKITFRDVATRRIGDIAVVTGINDLTGDGIRSAHDQKGLSIRFTQIWVLRDSRWLREAFQATPIKGE